MSSVAVKGDFQLQSRTGPASFGYTLDRPDGTFVETVSDANMVPTQLLRDARGNVLRRIQQEFGPAYPGNPNDVFYNITFLRYTDTNDPDLQTHQSVPFRVHKNQLLAAGKDEFNVLPSQISGQTLTWATLNRYDEDGNLTGSASGIPDADAHDLSGNIRPDVFERGSNFTYNQFGQPETITDAAGTTTTNMYDEKTGSLLETFVTDELDHIISQTKFDYHPDGNLKEVRDAEGQTVSSFKYNQFGDLTESTDASGVTRYFVYDDFGNQTLSYVHWEDPADLGNVVDKTIVTRTIYDEEGRVTETHQYTVGGPQFYSNANDLDSVPPDWTTLTEYDDAGRVDRSVDRFGTETRNFYDVRGNLLETRTASKHAGGPDTWVVSRTSYDNNGRAVYTVDPYAEDTLGDTPGTQTIYDALGRIVETRRYGSVTIQLQTHLDVLKQQVGSVTASNLLSTSKSYFNSAGQLWKNVDNEGTPDALTTWFRFDTAGRQTYVIQVIDLNQNGTPEFTADGDGIPISGAEALITKTDYDAVGRQSIVTDAAGRSTLSVYDELGRVIKTVFDDGTVTETRYNKLGQREAAIAQYDPDAPPADFDSITTTYEYDTAGRLSAVNLPEIDNPLNPGEKVRPRTEYRYDSYGNQTDITTNAYRKADGTVVYLKKDVNGNDVPAATYNVGTTTRFTYDHLGRQTSRTLPLGVINGIGFTERMVYNDTRLAALTTPGTSVGLGQLEYTVDFEGRVTTHRYDNTALGAGRQIGKYYYNSETDYLNDRADGTLNAPAQKITYKYDALGRLVESEDSEFGSGTAAQTKQKYDAEGRVTQIASPQGFINYGYDNLGRLVRTWTSTTDSGATAITETVYTYDPLGRLKTVDVVKRNTQVVTEVPTEYRYDKVGNLDQVESPTTGSPVIADYQYDTLNRVDLLQHYKDNGDNSYGAGDTLLAEYDYTVRADGKRTKVVEKIDLNGGGLDTTTIDWAYDALGRLIGEAYDSDIDNLMDYIAQYRYDLASNRKEHNVDRQPTAQAFSDYRANGVFPTAFDEETDYIYDSNDRLLVEQLDNDADPQVDVTTTYEYGGPTNLGAQQTKKTLAELSETHTYQYNVLGRMSQSTVVKPGTTTVNTYKYSTDGIRVVQTEQVNGGTPSTTIFHIDPHNHTGHAQVVEEGLDDVSGDGKLQWNEVDKSYAFGHDVLSQATSATLVQYLVYDGHGSTRALIDTSGALINGQRYAYDAYGNMLAGNGLASITSAQTRLLYSGEWTVASTALQNLRARWYDPRVGRFPTLDPISGSMEDPQSLHKYLYTTGDPILFADPTGLFEGLAGLSAANSIATTLNALDAQIGQFAASALGFDVYTDPVDLLFARELGIFPSWIYDAGAAVVDTALELMRENAGALGFAASVTFVGVVLGGSSRRGLLGQLRDYNDAVVGLQNAITQGARPAAVHDLYVNIVRPGAKRKPFDVPFGSAGRLGAREVDDWDAVNGIIFEGNTTPWATMTLAQLTRKLDEATKDGLLLRFDPDVKRAIWFGTEPLPYTGFGGQLRDALEREGIEYWVVVP
jgi:RHS repeat-associated protein